jgi:integrase/recombinase XerC
MSVSAFTSYLALERNYSPHTVKAYEKDILEFQAFCRDIHELDSIDDIDYNFIRNWIVGLVENQISNRTVNRKVASLKAYYKFLMKIHKISASPLAKHKALKIAKKIEIPFSESEMSQVFNEISFENNFEGIRDRLVIELFYATGIRRSELINLKMSNVDIQGRTIKVLGKRNKERIIPMLKNTATLFEDYFEKRENLKERVPGEYVFLTKTGNIIYETLVYRIINGYFSKVSSKIKKSPHILRHTFATHMLTKGADLNSVKELLGHSSLASTQVYTHNSIAELKKVHLKAHPRGKQ